MNYDVTLEERTGMGVTGLPIKYSLPPPKTDSNGRTGGTG